MNPAIEGCQLQLVIPSETSWLMQIQDPRYRRIRNTVMSLHVTLNDSMTNMQTRVIRCSLLYILLKLVFRTLAACNLHSL